MSDGSVHFGVMRVELHLPGVDNLKGKRALLNRTKAALRRDLECSVAEVAYQDLWQRSVLGIAAAASSITGVDRILDRVVAVIERDPRIVVTRVASDVDTLAADAGGSSLGAGPSYGSGPPAAASGPGPWDDAADVEGWER